MLELTGTVTVTSVNVQFVTLHVSGTRGEHSIEFDRQDDEFDFEFESRVTGFQRVFISAATMRALLDAVEEFRLT